MLLQLPLFPLQTVLFPGGWLPLRIFEIRYLDMIARCHKAGAPFGVVSLSAGSETRQPATDGDTLRPAGEGYAAQAFFSVGTLARITRLDRPQAALMLIQCVGAQRFRIQRSAQQKYGLWVGDVELLADDSAVPVPDDLQHARDALRTLVHNIEHSIEHSGEAGVQMPLCAPYRWDDCGWLANRWCEMLPLSAELKQRLMAIDSPLLRLELVADTLAQLQITTARSDRRGRPSRPSPPTP
ncbi:MAG: LON peptidase substrate-binding domain-containing protein [Burkholderiales bacterium]|nr:LON peptidase substrate-binding domain-containing protein [Burkholderiales bacterium]